MPNVTRGIEIGETEKESNEEKEHIFAREPDAFRGSKRTHRSGL